MSLSAFRDLRPPPFLTQVLNGPLPQRSPFAALRDYYDAQTLQYLFSVGNGLNGFDSTTSTRLLGGLALDQIRRRFQTRRTFGAPAGLPAPAAFSFHFRQQVDAAFERELFAASTTVCFDETYHQFQPMFWGSVRAKREKSGYFLFDNQHKRVYFEEMPVAASLNEAADIYRAGEYHRGHRVLANLHTHPGEIVSLKDGFTDLQIYERQYAKADSDGQTAVLAKMARYTLGRHNVDFFSPGGFRASRNNLTTMHGLFSGTFNIYQHAFEVHGGKRH